MGADSLLYTITFFHSFLLKTFGKTGNQVDTTLHLAYKKSWIDNGDTAESPGWLDSIRVEQLGFGVYHLS